MNITLGTTYYNNPNDIIKFIENHVDYVDELIIVDDGSSSEFTITNFVRPNKKIKLYRVKKDYGFNSHGCRNLIMKQSDSEFVILLDSDRMLNNAEYAIRSIKSRKLKLDTLYRFTAHSGQLGVNTHESVNDFLISKTHFFSAGGYDEEIIGSRDGDRQFFKQLLFFGKERLLHDIDLILLRKPSVILNNNNLVSKNDIKVANNKGYSVVLARMKCPEPNKPILTFEWEQIT